MKSGTVVRVIASGAVTDGVVLAVSGTGPSTFKRVDVQCEGAAFADVPHVGDRIGSEPCWCFASEVPAVLAVTADDGLPDKNASNDSGGSLSPAAP